MVLILLKMKLLFVVNNKTLNVEDLKEYIEQQSIKDI